MSEPPLDRPAPGRVLLFTGGGRGKTTAALGLALRAVGHGLRVCVIQFIKSRTDTGEVRAARRLGHRLEIHPLGAGFVREPGGGPEDRAAAAHAMALARSKARACDVLVLDEVLCAVTAGLVPGGDVARLVESRPPGLHVVLTGRGAPPELLALADTVTEMVSRKHAHDGGTPATPGIEY